jgi:Holliday junction resolvase RusA-like endonuclease
VSAIHLVLPLPPKGCSPNDRPAHWSQQRRVMREYKHQVEMEARRIPASQRPGWERAETRAVFYFATNRRRDEDNAAASLKAAWDGIAAAGIVANDAGLTHRRPELRVDPERPRVELTLTPLEP